MAHMVKCTICGAQFDRDAEPYVRQGTRRYAQASCAAEKGIEAEVIDPNEYVNCVYCKELLSKIKDPFVLVSKSTYAHKHCAEAEEAKEQSGELTDEEKLIRYIKKLFDTDYISPRIRKQLNDYVNKQGYSYTGIHKALIYYYEIKKNEISKEYGDSIGIVGFVYQDAFNYFYSIWEAQQKNQNKTIEQYIPQIKEIIIPTPKTNIKKRKIFTFLDNEESENEI